MIERMVRNFWLVFDWSVAIMTVVATVVSFVGLVLSLALMGGENWLLYLFATVAFGFVAQYRFEKLRSRDGN
jgi:hypothetical protein